MASARGLFVVGEGDEPRPHRTLRRQVGGVDELTDEQLQCRDSSLRHKWDFKGDEDFVYYRRKLVRITRVFRCDRGCGCEKREELEVPGFTRIGKPQIDYPWGYLVRGGNIANEDVRAEYYARRGVMTKK
jgi:hypothetical protein